MKTPRNRVDTATTLILIGGFREKKRGKFAQENETCTYTLYISAAVLFFFFHTAAVGYVLSIIIAVRGVQNNLGARKKNLANLFFSRRSQQFL